jgi:hypothetical protein
MDAFSLTDPFTLPFGSVHFNQHLMLQYDNGLLIAPSNALIVTPLPAAFPLFATGLGILGLLGWRRKRTSGNPRLISPTSLLAALGRLGWWRWQKTA